jgi:hypothetical protein
MLKRFSLITLITASFALSISCASKKKVENAPVGTEGAMDANVASKDIAFDSAGSDSGKISGLTSVHFDYDSSTLSTDARRELGANAEWIKSKATATAAARSNTIWRSVNVAPKPSKVTWAAWASIPNACR